MPRSIVVILGLLLTTTCAFAAGDYQILGATSSRIEKLERTETTVLAGDNPLDQFKMTRLVKRRLAPEEIRGAILLVPPLGFSFTFFEQRDPDGAFGSSIAEYLALRDYDVYGYSPRWDGVSAGVCEAGLLDFSVMAGWDLQSIVDDLTFLRSQIDGDLVVGGLSLGAIAAIAVVNAHPDDYAGVLLWEGILATTAPDAVGLDTAYCGAMEGLLGAGILFDGVGFNVFKQVGQAAAMDPSGLTPNPLFPPVLTNHQAMVLAFAVPDPANPVTMVVPTYVIANGSFEEDRFFFASEARATEATRRLYSYYPFAVMRDVYCSIAGLDDQHVANLGSFTGPVLGIGGTRGYGPYMQEQIDMFGSADARLLLKQDFGHLDHFLHKQHRKFVERPIRDWLLEVFP